MWLELAQVSFFKQKGKQIILKGLLFPKTAFAHCQHPASNAVWSGVIWVDYAEAASGRHQVPSTCVFGASMGLTKSCQLVLWGKWWHLPPTSSRQPLELAHNGQKRRVRLGPNPHPRSLANYHCAYHWARDFLAKRIRQSESCHDFMP